LQGLNEDLNTAPKFGQPLPEETIQDMRTEASLLFTKRKTQMKDRDHSTISEKFSSLLGERIKCLSCKKPKAKFNEELCLSIPLVKGELPPAEYFQVSSTSSESDNENEESTSIKTKKAKFNSSKYFNTSLDQGLTQYLNLETLDADQKLYCSTCKSQTQVSKQTELWELPEVLVVHVKRFVFSAEDMDFEKVHEEISYEKEMTIQST